MRFVPGSTVRLREVLHGAVWLETPATVVADEGGVVALGVAPGARFAFPPHPFGEHPWSGQREWTGPYLLRLHPLGEHYSVWRFFRDGEPEGGWYVNFERPALRGDGHLDVDDWGLDTVIAGDRSWRWKDVDDPEGMVGSGRLTLAELRELRAAAVEFQRLLRGGRPRWWERWSSWRPPV